MIVRYSDILEGPENGADHEDEADDGFDSNEFSDSNHSDNESTNQVPEIQTAQDTQPLVS